MTGEQHRTGGHVATEIRDSNVKEKLDIIHIGRKETNQYSIIHITNQIINKI